MILYFSNGLAVRGDTLQRAVLRSDLSPVPMTLEADITSDTETLELLREGGTLSLADGTEFSIVKSEPVTVNASQGDRLISAVRVTALLKSTERVAYVLGRAVILEDTTLAGIYKAVGASISGVLTDITVSRFYAMVGDVPSFQIRQILQEAGGSIRWRSGKLQFLRYRDLVNQPPDLTLSDIGATVTDSGFLERHQIPNFMSLDDTGTVITGAWSKERRVRYTPHKTKLELNNLSRSLVQRQSAKVPYNQSLTAGMTVLVAGEPAPMVVVTAVHTLDGAGDPAQYTKLFLASLEV